MKRGDSLAWVDLASYLVFSLMIIGLILCLLGERYDLLVLLCLLLAAILGITLVRLFALEKRGRRYRALIRWLEEEEPDPEQVPPEAEEDVRRLLTALERRNSYETLQARMEYAMLQNQINPHFLYNTLDAIRSQALLIHADEIADMTGRLSRFFRYSIRNRGDLVTITEELRNVEDYFAIQRYRFEDRFTLEIHCEQQEIMGCYIPKMTFQPLVENALYHGLEPKKGEGKITVRMQKGTQSLRVTIGDDGIGMLEEQVRNLNHSIQADTPPATQGRRGGIAMYNVNKRLRLMFGPMYGLHVTSTPGNGTDVEVLLPVVDEELRGRYTTEISG